MTEQRTPTQWELDRFGELTPAVWAKVWQGLQAAHERMLAGHERVGLDSNDVYGLLWLIQNDELAVALDEVTEVRRRKPRRARYQLIVIGEHNLVLYPWKFADDMHTPLPGAKMRLSQTRKELLGLTPAIPEQLSFDHAELTQEELDAEFEDLENFMTGAAEAGRLILIPYASNPHAGVLRVYFAEASQADESGHLSFHHIQEIPRPATITTGTTTAPAVVPAPVRAAPAPATNGAGTRFDETGKLSPIPLSARNPASEPATAAGPQPKPETGSDE
ncbi:hypothetical protein [Nocardia asiatica]|uniref:hypothetical protein n=1 Tax=Nocardia asiatica TaxID=209252 RepID=UPI002457BF7C|nr:hypothetical protein [Nocardia asiatica]